jgi:hypothetical protein
LCYKFLLQLQIYRPQPGLNMRILGPMACMIATRPPGRTTPKVNVWRTISRTEVIGLFFFAEKYDKQYVYLDIQEN